jgi:hypothetical protein
MDFGDVVHDPEPIPRKSPGADGVSVTHQDALEIFAAVIAALVTRRAVQADLIQTTSVDADSITEFAGAWRLARTPGIRLCLIAPANAPGLSPARHAAGPGLPVLSLIAGQPGPAMARLSSQPGSSCWPASAHPPERRRPRGPRGPGIRTASKVRPPASGLGTPRHCRVRRRRRAAGSP